MQPVRGTRDIMGSDMLKYNFVVDTASYMAHLYNFSEVQLPVFEFSEVFYRSLGETSDVVSKETYTFMDRDKTSITLRPEFTASIVRHVYSAGLTQSTPLKLFTYGPVFRHERPQKARYRQFNQINYELIGMSEQESDFEALSLADQLLKSLGITDVTLNLSTIGDLESRNKYKEALVSYLSKYHAELSHDSKMRLEKNPLRVLDSKDENDKKIVAEAPIIYEYLNIESAKRFEAIQQALDDNNIVYKLNPKIVRGLDYYSHTVFEYVTDSLGSQGTVLAGGSWGGLFAQMGNANLSAIGFAGGVERLGELCTLADADKDLVCLIPLGEQAVQASYKIIKFLRENGICADMVVHNKMSKQLQKADNMKAKLALIVGENELKESQIKVKMMHTGVEQMMRLTLQNTFILEIKKLLSN